MLIYNEHKINRMIGHVFGVVSQALTAHMCGAFLGRGNPVCGIAGFISHEFIESATNSAIYIFLSGKRNEEESFYKELQKKMTWERIAFSSAFSWFFDKTALSGIQDKLEFIEHLFPYMPKVVVYSIPEVISWTAYGILHDYFDLDNYFTSYSVLDLIPGICD